MTTLIKYQEPKANFGTGTKTLWTIRFAMAAKAPEAAKDEAEEIDVNWVYKNCSYWVYILAKNPKHRRFPIMTSICFLTCVIVFFGADGGTWFGRDSEWYSSIVAMVSHVNQEHLWSNMVMLVLLGYFFEFTEGILVLLCVLWGGGLVGFALHGIAKPNVRVRGASGAIYGVMWAQFSLLALNWREMPARWVRLIICLLLLTSDVAIYWFWRRPGISYSSHCFGALGGLAVSLVFGQNVKLRKWEVSLVWFGVALYATLVVIGLAGAEEAGGHPLYASAFAAALMPALVIRAALTTQRAWNLKTCCRAAPAGKDDPIAAALEEGNRHPGIQTQVQTL